MHRCAEGMVRGGSLFGREFVAFGPAVEEVSNECNAEADDEETEDGEADDGARVHAALGEVF